MTTTTFASLAGALAPDVPCLDLSTAQRWVGALEGARWGIILGIAFGALFAVLLFGSYLKVIVDFFKEWPPEVYEIGLYLVSVGLMVGGHALSPGVAPYVGFGGAALFGGALAYTVHEHEFKGEGGLFFLILAVVWGAAAAWYGSGLIGFIAVGALLASLACSELLAPIGHVLGYKEDSTVGSGTVAAFLILKLFVALRAFGVSPGQLAPFEYGGLWLGSFVGYGGLLIMSSRWFDRRYPYGFMQLVTIAAGAAALVVGSWLGIPELLRIGGTFFVLWVLAKIIDIPVDGKRGVYWIGLLCSIVMLGVGWYAKTHIEQMQPYLLML